MMMLLIIMMVVVLVINRDWQLWWGYDSDNDDEHVDYCQHNLANYLRLAIKLHHMAISAFDPCFVHFHESELKHNAWLYDSY